MMTAGFDALMWCPACPQGRKSESGSDGVTVSHSGGSDTQHRSSPLKLTPRTRNSSGAEGSAGSGFCVLGKSYLSSGSEGSRLGLSQTLTKSLTSSSAEASPRGRISQTLFKSGSFSGTPTSGRKIPERYAASDPAMQAYSLAGDVTSGTETEDECRSQKQKVLPVFKLGPVAGDEAKRDGDSDVDKKSAHTVEEQLSSFSEQAWDNYQVSFIWHLT